MLSSHPSRTAGGLADRSAVARLSLRWCCCDTAFHHLSPSVTVVLLFMVVDGDHLSCFGLPMLEGAGGAGGAKTRAVALWAAGAPGSGGNARPPRTPPRGTGTASPAPPGWHLRSCTPARSSPPTARAWRRSGPAAAARPAPTLLPARRPPPGSARRRRCRLAVDEAIILTGIPSPSRLKHVLKGEGGGRRCRLNLAVGKTVILLHPPLPSAGVSILMARGCR